jgi:hypothetical protein
LLFGNVLLLHFLEREDVRRLSGGELFLSGL